MKFLLFFLGVVFFLIFFMFSALSGVEWWMVKNIFWEANAYVVLSVLCIVFVFRWEWLKSRDKQGPQDVENKKQAVLLSVKTLFGNFFFSYIYYIAGALFYIALYFMLIAFFPNISISGVFLCINIVVLGLYFLESNFWVFQDFIGVNMVVISIYYILKHIAYLSWITQGLTNIELINVLFVFLFFFISLSRRKKFQYIVAIEGCFLGFLFLEILVIYKELFWLALINSAWISFLFWVVLLIFTDPLSYYSRVQVYVLRFWGMFFVGLFVLISSSTLFYQEPDQAIYSLPLIVSSFLFVSYYRRFLSYLSLALWMYSWVCSAVFVFLSFVWREYLWFLLIFISILWLFLNKAHKYYMPSDKIVFHGFSFLVNLLWVISFFFFYDFSILELWFLLFVESLYFFLSYYLLTTNHHYVHVDTQDISS